MSRMIKHCGSLSLVVLAGVAVGVLTMAPWAAAHGQQAQQDDTRREVAVSARDSGFTPATIEIRENDVVKVTLTAEDHPHSFVIDEYRIAKRARPGQPAVFEFRADRAGRFPFYCNLSSPGGKHEMRGELIVRER